MSFFEYPLSPQETNEAEGMQTDFGRGMEHVGSRHQVGRHASVPDTIHSKERLNHEQESKHWTGFIPPHGIIRWTYAIVFITILVALIVAPVIINEKLQNAKQQTSKPFLTEPLELLHMPSNTSKLFRDPYNTTGIYRAFVGDDRRGNDIFATIEYTLEACLLACNKYNEFIGSGRLPCVAGTMNYNQRESASGQRGANCFLKAKVGDDIDDTNPLALGFRLCPSGRCSFNDTIKGTG